MAFESAIPLNRGAYGRGADGRPRDASPRARSSESARQSVNISEDTLRRLARVKLGHALRQKQSYTRSGQIASESSVGHFLSTRA